MMAKSVESVLPSRLKSYQLDFSPLLLKNCQLVTSAASTTRSRLPSPGQGGGWDSKSLCNSPEREVKFTFCIGVRNGRWRRSLGELSSFGTGASSSTS